MSFAHVALAADVTTLTYEFEDVTAETKFKTSDNDSASGGKYTNLNGLGTKGEHSLTISTGKLAAGEYNLEFKASIALVNEKSNAEMSFSVDGGDEIAVDGTTCTTSAINPTYPNENYKMGKIAYGKAIMLSEGTHTITVTLKNSEDKAVKGALDCLTLTKENVATVSDGYIRLEAEDYVSGDIKSIENASGGKIVQVTYRNGDYTINFKFSSPEACDYMMELAAAQEFVSAHLSPIYFSVNGGSETLISSSNTTDSGSLYNVEGGTFPVKHLKYKTAIKLSEGTNTLTFRIAERRASGQSQVFTVVDWVDFIKVKDVDTLTAENIAPIKRGEEIPLVMRNESGEKITASDLDSLNITFADGHTGEYANGKIYARNYGKTDMKIAATKGSKAFNLTVPVEVISEKGFYVSDAKRTSGGISFKLNAKEDYKGGDKAFVAVYKKQGDMLTSIVKLESVDLPAVSEDENAVVTKEIDGLTADMSVSVFLVSGSDSTTAIYAKTDM